MSTPGVLRCVKIKTMIDALESSIQHLLDNLRILQNATPGVTPTNVQAVSRAFEAFRRTQMYRVGDELSNVEKEYIELRLSGECSGEERELVKEIRRLLKYYRLNFNGIWDDALRIKFRLDRIMVRGGVYALDIKEEEEEEGGELVWEWGVGATGEREDSQV